MKSKKVVRVKLRMASFSAKIYGKRSAERRKSQ
jgi:predicted site-specific integrase-resolvase